MFLLNVDFKELNTFFLQTTCHLFFVEFIQVGFVITCCFYWFAFIFDFLSITVRLTVSGQNSVSMATQHWRPCSLKLYLNLISASISSGKKNKKLEQLWLKTDVIVIYHSLYHFSRSITAAGPDM